MTTVTPADQDLCDLTQHEIQALKTRFNLADAHTHQRQSVTQHRLVATLPDLWYEAETTPQAVHEQRFVEAFFQLHGQPSALRRRPMLSYAASISTLVTGMYLARRQASVTLVEPCFDNLADVLMNCGVRLQPLPEDALVDLSSLQAQLRALVNTDALFLVDPNNPTGFSLLKHGREAFTEVARFCKETGKLLIFDFCFASFAVADPRVDRFDIYELLEDIGVSYITIEDTGKTWPVQDAKCAVLCCSDDIYAEIYNIHTSVLLNVSPFVLNMLEAYVRDSISDGLDSIRNLLTTNRETLLKAVSSTLLSYREPVVDVSVAWLELTDPAIGASQLQQVLRNEELYVLPGTYFYWAHRNPGERYIRVALARDMAMFAEGAACLRGALETLAP